MRNRFKPSNPKGVALPVALAGRTGAHRVLNFDVGSFRYLPDVPGHGQYLTSDWSKMLLYVEFTVNGHRFTRRVVNEQIGNFGVLWARIGGTTYQLYEA